MAKTSLRSEAVSLRSDVIKDTPPSAPAAPLKPHLPVLVENRTLLKGEVIPPTRTIQHVDYVITKAFNDAIQNDPMIFWGLFDNGMLDKEMARVVREALSLEGYVVVDKAF